MTEDSIVPKRILPKCSAMTKAGHPCPLPVISPEFPYCAAHIRSVKLDGHGRSRYEEGMPTELRRNFKSLATDGAKRDLTEETIFARTLLSHYIEKLEKSKDMQGNMVIPEKDADKILQILQTIRMLTESQAKVNPDRVVSIGDMKTIITRIIQIVRDNVPADRMDIREKIVSDISRFCMQDLMAKSMEIPFGSSVPKSNGPG